MTDKRVRPEGSSGKAGVGGGKKTGEDNAMSMFLAPAPASRPARPAPTKKTPAPKDALAQAFARLAPAQLPAEEPEPTRKSPDPSRPPRIGKDGKPRPHMSVKWKQGSNLEQIRFIEARSPTEVCIGIPSNSLNSD